jgi:hypothetical protein
MPGHPRPGPVERRNITLTPATAQRVEAWAALQGLTFSAAADALLRLGLQDAPPDAYAPVLELAVAAAVKQELARLTALQAAAALSAEAGYLAALALAKDRFPPERYALLKRAARHRARETVRRRAARWGQEDAAALVAGDPAVEVEDAAG